VLVTLPFMAIALELSVIISRESWLLRKAELVIPLFVSIVGGRLP